MASDELYLYPFFGQGVGNTSVVFDTADFTRKWVVRLTSAGPRFRDGIPSDLSPKERREILSAAGRDFATRPSKKRRADRARRKVEAYRRRRHDSPR